MANVLKLKRGSTELNLLASEGGGLRGQKWYPKMADILYSGIPPYLIEDMDVRVDQISHDDLATSMQALDQMRRWAAMYRSVGVIRDPIWLHAKMDGETGERRAYVRSIRGDWRSNQISGIGPPAAHDALTRLQIERHPYWESLSAITGTALTEWTTDIAVSHNYGAPAGDVGARIRELQITDPAEAGLDRVWIGLRSVQIVETPANFVPIWEIENVAAAAGTDCSGPTSDTTASPGSGNTKRTVSFATVTGWAKRWALDLQNVSVNYLDNIGRFLWLFRYKVDAETECEIYLRWGSLPTAATESFIEGPKKLADNTDWDFLEMGDAQIPPHSMKLDITTNWIDWVKRSTIEIWAKRTAGSGSLHMDCLCLIPLDEGYLIAKNIGCTSSLFTFRYYKAVNDMSLAICIDNLYEPRNWPSWSEGNFDLPPGNGNIVLVHAREASSVLADSITIPGIQWYPRWANLRGSE